MASLQKLQEKVDEALGKIQKGERDYVRKKLWPHIYTAITIGDEFPDKRACDWMVYLLYERLDKPLLTSTGEPEPINVWQIAEESRERAKTGEPPGISPQGPGILPS